MDAQMPELDGIGATREIRALPEPKCTVPIIALTANAMAAAEKEYLGAGMDDYISKPIQPEVLFAKLANIAKNIEARLPQSDFVLHTSDEEIPLDSGIAQVANLPALDLGKLASLLAVLPTAAVRDLLRLYMLDTDNHLALMRKGKSSGDLDAIARASHVIISTAGNMGAEQVSALARLLTDACREGSIDAVDRLVDELVAASVVTSDTIHSWLEGTAAVHEAPVEAHG